MESVQSAADQKYMAYALALAEATSALASPNPQVGCVLVHNAKIIGEGAHLYADRDHAEIVALKQAAAQGVDPAGATAYVTLEPCSHYGRTGPCADALIAARIARCIVATADPNPAVSGSGLARLRAAGVEVLVGPGQERARALNNAFAFSIQNQRPFVSLKAALSVDGFLAPAAHTRTPNQPHWLTGSKARAEVQRLRHASDAILTGIGTVLADDPALTDRTGLPRRRPLHRILLDSHLRLPLYAKLLPPAQELDLWIFTTGTAPTEKLQQLTELGVKITMLPTPKINLAEVLHHLHMAQFQSVLLEAGSHLNGAFLDDNLVDAADLFYAPTELSIGSLPFARGGHSPFQLESRLTHLRRQTFGPDVLVSGLLHDPWAALNL
jgi:diaminohydroxyphosphoribosylaminopyrimidine deaminase/5-amino-6-(5-phosphoribosylamino)uracil reductase